MIAPDTALTGLKRDRPEWKPWLSVVEEMLRESESTRWDAAVPTRANNRASTPLLAGATISVEARAVRRVLKRLIRTASVAGTPKMATLENVLAADVDVLALFSASLAHDRNRITAIADASGADDEALQAIVALVPVPFLQACNRAWTSSIPQSWVERYCPVCGSWPAFAEVRGIERSRYYRCGRCGGEWHAHMLSCPFCATDNHNELVALVPETAGAHAAIDACLRCLGYIKTLTRLQGCSPAAVLVEDLATVDLDVAALEQGYTRPLIVGYPIDVSVVDAGASRRFFSWRA